MTINSVEIDAIEFRKKLKTLDFMLTAENLVRPIKRLGLHKLSGNDDVALDFGSGDGRHSIYLSNFGYKVIAVDVDQSAIDLTRKRFSLQSDASYFEAHKIAHSSDLLSLDKKFDLIVAWEVLHWLGNGDDWSKTLNIFHKTLNKNGKLILTMPTERHYILGTAKEVGKHEYLAKEPSRAECRFFAPDLDTLKLMFAEKGYEILELNFYQHGNSKDDWNLNNPFSMYVFALSKISH